MTGPAIAANKLHLALNGTTTGGFLEAQAVFAATPVSLATVGDFITLTYTFTNTGGTLLAGGSASYIFNGLYFSGGSTPVSGGALNNSGLTSTPGSPYGSGNCANWQGYVSRIAANGASEAYTRPAQTNFVVGPSADQDLIGNGIGGGAYTNLPGVIFDSIETSATLALVSGANYTVAYSIALTAAGTLTVTNNLYNGTGTGGTLLFSQTNTASGTTNIVQSFDGLCIGVRNSGTSYNPTMDISKISINKSIFGSPGPSFNVTGGGAGCPGSQYQVGLSGSVATNVYYLYTNGVPDGAVAPVTGTGSAFNFASTISVLGTNTVLASNTVSSFTGLMNGSAVISLLPAPLITTQPTALVVATNSIGIFSVVASGSGLNYRWYRNGSALTDAGHVTGSATSTLVISPATTADAAAPAQGYYCVITNACGSAAISTTNGLTLDVPANLVWQGGNPNTNWDLATPNFTNSTGTAVVFHDGDNVTLDDSSTNPVVTIAGNYIAPTLLTENASQNYAIGGSGTISGAGALLMSGSGVLTVSNVNSFAGGSTIGSGTVKAQNYGGLGIGAITLSGGTLELPVSGSATLGLTNNLDVIGSGTLQYDLTGTYAAVIYGALMGNAGATLTLRDSNATTGTSRLRLYGGFTNNADIVLSSAGATIEIAPYNNATNNQVYNGLISGTGHFILRGGNDIFNNTNTFSDGTYGIIISDGALGVGADSIGTPPAIQSSPAGTGILELDPTSDHNTIFASGGAHTFGNPIQYIGYATNDIASIFYLGGSNNLTLSGAFQLTLATDPVGTNRTIEVDNTAASTFSGVISDNNLGSGITKLGTGPLYLDGANSYTGPTTNSAGLLAGLGTIAGPVFVESVAGTNTTASIGGGDSAAIGTLTISSDLTLDGNVYIRVNKALSPAQSNDMVYVSGSLTNMGAGTVTVTNCGVAALVPGDTFYIFSGAVSNGTSLAIAGGGVTWSNRLAVDGSIQALSLLNTIIVPTNSAHIGSFKMNGLNVVIGGTNGVNGGTYYLLESTNLAKPLSQWTTVATNVVNTNGASGAFTFTGTNAITTGLPQQFYILSNTNH